MSDTIKYMLNSSYYIFNHKKEQMCQLNWGEWTQSLSYRVK